MKNVIIVDDEFLVRLGLKTTINWSDYGYNIIGEAANGHEALEMFDKYQPDILMTDIKMPGMDGLELISAVKHKNKKVKVVILTNYSDFDYARRAIKLGASQYLLKSEITEKNLIEMLKTLSIESSDEEEPLPTLKQQQEAYLQNQILELQNNTALSPQSFTVPEQKLFTDSSYVILNCLCEVSQLNGSTIDTFNHLLSSLIDTHFHEAAYSISCLYKQFFVYIVCPVSYIHEKVIERLTKQAEMLARNIKQYSNVELSIGLSQPGDSTLFPEKLTEAALARQNCFFTSESIAVFSQNTAARPSDMPKISYTKIKNFIDSNEAHEFETYSVEIFDRLAKIRNYQYVKAAFIDFLSIAKLICEKYNMNKSYCLSPAKFDYNNFNMMHSFHTVKKYICDLYSGIFDTAQNSDNGYSHSIKTCLSYIENNYSLNITLDNVAKAADISSSYLSLIFKQEIGINFSTYLTQYRIDQAKVLLTTTNMKIYEIAEKVGFSSPYYFSKVFKEFTKLTCKEYKDKYMSVPSD